MYTATLFILLGLVGVPSCSGYSLEDIANGSQELLDLTVTFDENTPYWPSIERKGQNFVMRSTQNGYSSKYGYHYHAFFFSTSDQGGTHVDAWNHVNRKFTKEGLEAVPLTQFFGPAFVINISEKCRINRDYELQVEDILSFESVHGRIPDGALLFVYSGWSAKMYNKTDFWGTPEYFDLAKLHYPGVAREAASWLVNNRAIKLVGVETASIDSGKVGLELPAHATLLTHKVSVVELVTNLDKMPPTGAFVFGLPMKIKGSSGAPIRLVAVGWKKTTRQNGV